MTTVKELEDLYTSFEKYREENKPEYWKHFRSKGFPTSSKKLKRFCKIRGYYKNRIMLTIYNLRHKEGMTLSKIGKITGYSSEHVRQKLLRWEMLMSLKENYE